MPAIVLFSEEHGDALLDEFGRYRRDYELHVAHSSAAAVATTRAILSSGGTVALFVAESVLPDDAILAAFARWREVVPTARRVIALLTVPARRTGTEGGDGQGHVRRVPAHAARSA